MKLSRFNLWVKETPVAANWLLFNTRTQALIRINNDFKTDLESFSPRINSNVGALKQNGIIIEDDTEEENKLEDFFKQLKNGSGSLAFEVTLLTTYNCNFKCVYCFEEQVKNTKSLDKATAENIAGWLIKTTAEKGFKRLFIVYYGGEPLLNPDPIYDISRRLREHADKSGIEFGFGIITNGSLLTPKLTEELVPLGLKEVRISIDGYGKTHDDKRPFADGSPSFGVIINNLKAVIDKVTVGVTGNFDKESAGKIPLLLDYFEKEGILFRLSRIDFAPIMPRLGPKNNPGAIELGECLSFVEKEGLYKEVIAIKKDMMKRGIKINTGLAVNACPMIIRDGGIAIDPQGLIFRCNSFLGHQAFSIGNVRDGINESDGFSNIDAWKKCDQSCPYLPMCQGGCRFFSYLENKNLTGISCKREYFDRVIPELVKLEYEKMLKFG